MAGEIVYPEAFMKHARDQIQALEEALHYAEDLLDAAVTQLHIHAAPFCESLIADIEEYLEIPNELSEGDEIGEDA